MLLITQNTHKADLSSIRIKALDQDWDYSYFINGKSRVKGSSHKFSGRDEKNQSLQLPHLYCILQIKFSTFKN